MEIGKLFEEMQPINCEEFRKGLEGLERKGIIKLLPNNEVELTEALLSDSDLVKKLTNG